MQNEVDMVNHPPHYNQNAMECIDEMVVMFGYPDTIAFCKLNAWKYRYRAPHKGENEKDLKKADQYIQKAKELQEEYYGRR